MNIKFMNECSEGKPRREKVIASSNVAATVVTDNQVSDFQESTE